MEVETEAALVGQNRPLPLGNYINKKKVEAQNFVKV